MLVTQNLNEKGRIVEISRQNHIEAGCACKGVHTNKCKTDLIRSKIRFSGTSNLSCSALLMSSSNCSW